jgi:hypothetical protein
VLVAASDDASLGLCAQPAKTANAIASSMLFLEIMVSGEQ